MAHVGSNIADLVQSDTPVTLVGGGFVGSDDLSWALARSSVLVAADGGADIIVEANQVPDAVIGDMDSLSEAAKSGIPANRLFEVTEQETTDFEKCLSRITAPGILGLGFLGGRLDHSLATLATMARRRARCLVLGPEDITFVAPPRLELDVPVGTRVSLFPFETLTGRSSGLRWPIDTVEFSPAGRIGTSNISEGPVVLEAEGILVMLPRALRDVVFDALFAEN